MLLKTNWKYILIVAVLAIGILFGYEYLVLQKEKTPEENNFVVIKRIPGGTQSGVVEREKVVQGPLDKISIVFNRDIDEATLTENNFYALMGLDEKVPGKIEYEKNTKTATLVFDEEFHGGQIDREIRITVVVEGIKDLLGKEIETLQYNIDIVESDKQETADWKTYTNTRVNYSFEYPASGLQLDLNETIKYPSTRPGDSKSEDLVQFATSSTAYSIRVDISAHFMTVEAWITGSGGGGLIGSGFPSRNLSDYIKTTVGGITAYTSKEVLSTYLVKDTKFYTITAYAGEAPKVGSDAIYNHLLSSFEFTK